MPPIERSAGPFPSGSAFGAVSRDQLQKAWYQTTTSRDVPGRAPNAEAVGENFDNIHSVGRKSTRYLDFQHSRSPLTTRDSCRYTKDYIPLPLGDNAINRALAEEYKGGLSAAQKGPDVPLDGMTTNECELRAPRQEDRRRCANPVMQTGQEPTDTLNGCGTLLEKKSHEQRTMVRPAPFAQAERARPPKPTLEIGSVHPVRPRTTYMRHFVNSEPSRTLSSSRSMSSSRSFSTPDLPELSFGPLNHDPEIFRVKRQPNMMPGK